MVRLEYSCEHDCSNQKHNNTSQLHVTVSIIMIFTGIKVWFHTLLREIIGPRNSWTNLPTSTLELDQAFFQTTNGLVSRLIF